MTTLPAPPGTRARRGRRWNPAYAFVAPSVVLIAVFILEPIVQSAWMSLHDWSVGEASHKMRGLGNYSDLLHDSRFWNALKVTLLFTAGTAVGQVALGLALAEALRRTTWFTSLLRTAFFFPFIASMAVVGIVWRFLLDPQVGLVDAWLGHVGLGHPQWLQSTSLALPTLVVVGIWKGFGFTMIVLLAAIQAIPEHLYEAARLDGAGRAAQFRHVTLPGMRQATLFVTVIATITGLQLFDLSYVMTGGGPVFHTESVVQYLYQRGFVDFSLGYASAVAWVLTLVIFAVALLQLRILRYSDVD
ncbi:multiple sugar transport system permease protein/raffinose/stachyose/melibiose transport system permease protein [Motilibacter peucedani]|uniref:Multiple sugar transport system permease protein/raffinose/stachyose/melibiose transport system permease protein n=1 Tax=Motilibacter peucedani TaxID=598650 RepID=A0A420XT58_9ACTN|nr:sugar ABC transporter permease [Motilibacter peucedani]RKS79941.1 multiple sugar transport system permease protein/raffinose/stachyose/melibiose transport system permease protein [Motilibacter peucedani]